jgi:hypothetical protein
MTDQSFPITPPPELVQQWASKSFVTQHLCTQIAQWGAEQELEACREWLASKLTFREDGIRFADELRAARRPKPPTLKEQALLQLDTLNADLAMHGRGCDLSQIRRALEALPND